MQTQPIATGLSDSSPSMLRLFLLKYGWDAARRDTNGLHCQSVSGRWACVAVDID